jgi:DNA-binding NtrC family response regulator
MNILLVEDEKISRITLTEMLRKEGYYVSACDTGNAGLEMLEHERFEVVLTDLRLPGMNGLDIVKAAKEKNADCTVIVITAYATVETAIAALKLGAYDYVTKPFSPDKLLSMLTHIRQFKEILQENRQLKNRIHRYETTALIGSTPVMQRLMATLQSVAPTDHTVLVQGESGTGKELVARILHQYSERSNGPFVAINCATLPESLLESELFGHEKGAFTGAHRRHKGYIARAHGGTLFIDDIDDLPLLLQVKLLRVLQEREVQPVGSSEAVPVDFRVVCATKVNLHQLVKEGKFREDLFYRLNIIPIAVPPLRDRKDDLPILIDHFIAKHNRNKKTLTITPAQLDRMMRYHWPGNVRELENTVQRMLALPQEIDVLNFTEEPTALSRQSPAALAAGSPLPADRSFDELLRDYERSVIDWALKESAHNISNAARLLKIPRSTLHSKMEKLDYFDPKKKNV